MSEHEWKIAKSAPQCQLCGKAFVRTKSIFRVCSTPNPVLRGRIGVKYASTPTAPADVYYFWKTTHAKPNADGAKKPRPIFDLDHVFDFFKRLENEEGPQKIAFRYILALMLSRKKALFAGEKKKDDQGRIVQNYREKKSGSDQLVHAVIEPDLSEEEIHNLSSELGQLLGLTSTAETPPTAPVAPPDAQCV